MPSPYVTCAVFCERFLIEKDEVGSLIRVVDKVTQVAALPPGASQASEKIPYVTPLTFYVSIWAEAPGEHKLTIFTAYDGSERNEIATYPLAFTSPKQGRNFAIRFDGFPKPGTLWAETVIDGVTRTRTPLTLLRTLGTQTE